MRNKVTRVCNKKPVACACARSKERDLLPPCRQHAGKVVGGGIAVSERCERVLSEVVPKGQKSRG